MKNILRVSLTTALLAWGGLAAAADIQVMTQNQYLGGDIGPVIATAGTGQFNAAVVAALQQVSASRTPERIQALAREILERKPHLVGLQEVWSFVCLPAAPTPPGYGCDDPSIRNAFNDHLTRTMTALGGAYGNVAQVTNLDLQSFGPYPGIPFLINEVPAFLRVTDRDVILARSEGGVAASADPVDFGCASDGQGGTRISDHGCNFQFVVDLAPIGRIERGYVGVDVTVNGRAVRFVNTHLETRDGPIPPIVQAAQMAELLGQVATTPAEKTLILAGDFNADPADTWPASGVPTPYWMAVGLGFFDVWALRPGNVAGLTCCQRSDLRNMPSLLSQRIDHLFVRGMPARVKDARVLGGTANYRLMPHGRGLWPSDHAAVAATLYYR